MLLVPCHTHHCPRMSICTLLMQDRSAAEKTKLDLPELIVISEQRRSSVEKENLSEVKIMPEQERKSPDIYIIIA